MPELPDIAVYIECLERRIAGETLENVRIGHPFLVCTVDPPVGAAAGKRVLDIKRIGKHIAIGLEDDLHIVLHLMIASRLQWRDPGAALPGKRRLAASSDAR
jgi:formamidopyrimidine-DNA glycosylase